MSNFINLYKNLLNKEDYSKNLEICYKEILDSYEYSKGIFFMNLLEMIIENDERVNEIRKVMNFIKIPLKRY